MTRTTPSALKPLPMAKGRVNTTARFVREPLSLFSELTATHGDIFAFRVLNTTYVGVTNPHHIKYTFQERMANFTRDTDATKVVEPFMGRGLATIADHMRWRRNRRLAQPAFHQRKITALGEVMTNAIAVVCEDWAAFARSGETIDVGKQMSHLTLRIVAQALFGVDPDNPDVIRFAQAAHDANHELGQYVRMPLVPLAVPTPSHRRFWRAIADMDRIVYSMIAALRADGSGENNDGLLAMFMSATDADTGERLSDKELRDEVVTMLFAGHETSAATLTWAFLIPQKHPEVRQRLLDEANTVLSGRPASMIDVPKLSYTKQVIDEALRLYPPGWNIGRRAETDDEIGGFGIPAGSQLIHSFFHAHRHPEFWDRPEEFDPDRFTPDAVAARDRHAFLPFGMGGHLCIGNVFAMTEMQLALATITQRFELTVASPDLTPTAVLTLATKNPVVATVKERL